MELISKRAEVKAKKSIATQATFAYVLYDALQPSYQKVLDHVKDSGALNSEGLSYRQRAVVEHRSELQYPVSVSGSGCGHSLLLVMGEWPL